MTQAYDYNVPTSTDLAPVSAPVVQETKEPSIEEHASMIRKGFEHVLNKALEASDLAKRVAELEAQVQSLQRDLTGAMQEVAAEREESRRLNGELNQVRSILAQRESTVHDLVMERDIAIGERDQAQRERDEARREAADRAVEQQRLERDLDNERELSHALEERCNTMQARINALKEAFNGLHNL